MARAVSPRTKVSRRSVAKPAQAPISQPDSHEHRKKMLWIFVSISVVAALILWVIVNPLGNIASSNSGPGFGGLQNRFRDLIDTLKEFPSIFKKSTALPTTNSEFITNVEKEVFPEFSQ